MSELIKDFDLLDNKKRNILVIGLAEGPGGFLESIFNNRNKSKKNTNDKYICMTLIGNHYYIPGWSNLKDFSNSVYLFFGKDNTGNIYNIENIKELHRVTKKNKADIITGDGGFDFSNDYNNQEVSAYRIILCEIVAAIGSLKINGFFILKIYDIHTIFTKKIIYFLTSLFKNVYIVKPFTSRPANSEKYVVCKHFLGVKNKNLIYQLYNIIENWDNNIVDIFENELPNKLFNLLYSFNIYLVTKQVRNILLALKLSETKNKNIINKIKQKQIFLAILWCKKYNVKINKYSKFNLESEFLSCYEPKI